MRVYPLRLRDDNAPNELTANNPKIVEGSGVEAEGVTSSVDWENSEKPKK